MIVKGGNANGLTYNLTLSQSFHLESISADVDCTAAVSDSSCDAILRDNAGLLIARCRSSTSLRLGTQVVMTFAPELPDSETLLNIFGSDVITSGLADTILPEGGSVRVQVSDPAARITQMRLWVENVEDDSAAAAGLASKFGKWALVPGPGA
jgi:hypothetical protein